jgi:hypothetical protein
MGKFACHCGYVISDSVYPCPQVGELKWETETENQSEQFSRNVADFLSAVERGQKENWIQNFFSKEYPLNENIASIIVDIYSNVSNKQGRAVYQCPKCERIYLQKEFYANEWTCFEKAK